MPHLAPLLLLDSRRVRRRRICGVREVTQAANSMHETYAEKAVEEQY